MSRIAVDLDGVIFEFVNAYTDLLTEQTGVIFPASSDIWPTTWFDPLDHGVSREDDMMVWNNYILQENSTFWRLLHPVPGATEAVAHLNQLAHQGHEVYFISDRKGHGAKVQTEKALWDAGMRYPTVLLTPSKVPIIRSLDIDMFIDDKPETVIAVANAAAEHGLPVRGGVFIQDRPYNRHVEHDGIARVNSVAEMLKMKGLWL